MTKLVVGCGYLGERVARVWRGQGHEVHVTTRRPERQSQLAAEGYRAIRLDVTKPDAWPNLPSADTVLLSIGFDRSSGALIHDVYVKGVRNLLAGLPQDTGRVIYISSTGVYGQTDGSWVDEQSECQPTRPGGKACLDAENSIRQHKFGPRSMILRLAGIYGPGRVPRRDRIANRRPVPARADGFLNLIHVDDAARVVVAADQQVTPPATYVVSDGHPLLRRDFYAEIARRMGVQLPEFCEVPADSSAGRRSSGSKRASNRRLLADIEIDLLYSDFRKGLDTVKL
jgi:nucleoside-diphosphate-sugar epimerase